MYKLYFAFLIVLVISNPSLSQDTLINKPVENYRPIIALTPGATHFKDGRIGTGIFLTTLTIGATTAGIVYNNELKNYSNSPYYNYPLFTGMNAYGVDKCDLVHKSLTMINQNVPDFKYDNMTYKQLIAAPFKPKNILAPVTGICLSFAALQLWLETKNRSFTLSDVNRIHVLNGFMKRNPALGVMGATSMVMSWEAGVAEEYIFRNYMLPLYDYRWGQRKGLLVSSAVFGGMHAFNYLFVDKPDALTVLYHVSVTSFFGYVLGKSVQNNNYKIGRAIAAHTWYDFAVMLGSFIANPEDNVFGVNMQLKF